MSELRMHLIDELMHFSDAAWKYKDPYGVERTAFKATREPGSRRIVFRNLKGAYRRESYGASVQWVGMIEEVTRREFEKRRDALAAKAKQGGDK